MGGRRRGGAFAWIEGGRGLFRGCGLATLSAGSALTPVRVVEVKEATPAVGSVTNGTDVVASEVAKVELAGLLLGRADRVAAFLIRRIGGPMGQVTSSTRNHAP